MTNTSDITLETLLPQHKMSLMEAVDIHTDNAKIINSTEYNRLLKFLKEHPKIEQNILSYLHSLEDKLSDMGQATFLMNKDLIGSYDGLFNVGISTPIFFPDFLQWIIYHGCLNDYSNLQ